MHRRDDRRRRLVLLSSVVAAMSLVAACTDDRDGVVTGVSIPPPRSTTTTVRPQPSTTQRVTTTERVTTTRPTTTLAPTTTYVPAASGPPSSIAGEYVTGGGRRPRTPCEPGPDLGQLVLGGNCRHLIIDGMRREYVVYIPASLDRATPAPLVVFLHADDSNGDEALRVTGWKRRAEDRGMIVAFPTSLEYDPVSNVPTPWTFRWNGFALRDQVQLARRVDGYPAAAPMPADDVSFVQTMIADIAYQWPIDPARVFAAGVQSGADLASRLALELPDTFAAVALVGDGLGSAEHELPAPTRSVPTIMLIGTEDHRFREIATGTPLGLSIPLDIDGFLGSEVGRFVLARLSAFTGTDPAAVETFVEQHRTIYTMTGPGVGGGGGFAQVQVVNGLADEYPSIQNNLAELIGTVQIANFFHIVAPPP